MIKIADGRTPFEVFFDERHLGNSRVDPCSKILKRKLADSWIEKHFNPFNVVCYVGIGWDEIHRYEGLAPRKSPYVYAAPMTKKPYLHKDDMLQIVRDQGLTVCDLYKENFPHNNCSGACVKAGVSQWVKLLNVRPEVFQQWEENEQRFRDHFDKDVSILKDKTLRKLREEVEEGVEQPLHDFGGCGCFLV